MTLSCSDEPLETTHSLSNSLTHPHSLSQLTVMRDLYFESYHFDSWRAKDSLYKEQDAHAVDEKEPIVRRFLK